MEYAATKLPNFNTRPRRSRLFLMKGILANIGTPSGSSTSRAVRIFLSVLSDIATAMPAIAAPKMNPNRINPTRFGYTGDLGAEGARNSVNRSPPTSTVYSSSSKIRSRLEAAPSASR